MDDKLTQDFMKQSLSVARPSGLPVITEEGQEIVRPEVLNFIMLSTMAAHLARLRELEDDRASEGLTDEIEIDATSTLKEVVIPDKWQSVSITDDGPNSVKIKVNKNTTATKWKKLKIDETFEVDFKEHKIQRLFLVCDTGETATLRVAGKF